jgi:Zn-dependent protease
VVFLIAVVIAITVHEYSHAWAADRLGDDTPYLQGRLTLNPLAHLDPIGSITFLLVGFGWGKPVVYNPMRLSRQIDELWIALAGPASNLILAFAFNLLAYSLSRSGLTFIQPAFLEIAAGINVLLAAFNMIPIPPLDGSSIVAYFYPNYRSVMGGQMGMLFLLVLIFFPLGGSNLLGVIMAPILHAFSYLASGFGTFALPTFLSLF